MYRVDRQDQKQVNHPYHVPVIKTYTSDELLGMIGPVLAGNNSNDLDNFLGGDEFGYYAPEDEAIKFA